ncbi:sigma 54-interacting transcriptional regulator [Novosphingobium profundi]|uniref:sigma-54 interaction domain-containing protein n=1 Tax=Novosphingobium profundi TaxID=1774954 RepID=UPI001BD9660A|nr:sigma 54-interacting transcriptional regulator [Novosphingobium profundi]MBT0670422.1 sigma 54-interacting transcriptional regulator [Novosphingobium profundi]
MSGLNASPHGAAQFGRAITSPSGSEPQTGGNHAALVARARTLAGSLCDEGALDLRDIAESSTIRPGRRLVRLERLDCRQANGLERDPLGVILRYADPVSETALAMLLAAMAGPGEPIAADPVSLSVLALAERLAASDIPVLINGPTGTGKEVLSRFIHARSPRCKGPFIAVNCAAMPETMLEAMLFGHRKGAFTGATEASEGFMRAADGGTLLLDEIAELPLSLQAKLLRALQEQEVVPIGSTQPIPVNLRVIACANRDLPTEVAEGRFRADLFYRLNVFPLTLPALKARGEDIAPLAYAMAMRHCAPQGPVPCFSESALAMLKLHAWPGNVRELENVIRRALLLAHTDRTITPAHIVFDSPARLLCASPLETASGAAAMGEADADADHARRLSSVVQKSEARAIVETLESCGGNRQMAARELGISERTLRYRLAALRDAGIHVGRTTSARLAGGRR